MISLVRQQSKETYPNSNENTVSDNDTQHAKISKFLDECEAFSKELKPQTITTKKINATLYRKESSQNLQHSFYDPQKITELLETQKIDELKNIFIGNSEIDNDKLTRLLEKFSRLNLNEDFQEILNLSSSAFSIKDIRSYIIAALINRDKVAIKDLDLTKHQIKLIGPILTYLDCVSAFDISWSKNEIVSFLDSCIYLKTLKISTDKIRRLPKLDFCEMLDCSYCDKLTELPNLPECIELKCHACTKLLKLPELGVCEILDCRECPNLKLLPNLENCKKLLCKLCTGITSLPDLPLCEIVDCSQCTNLKNIPSLPSCKELYCNVCTSLLSLPDLTSLKILNCLRCIKLNSLPALPECIEIDCSKCTNLTEIPNFLACEELRCTGCTNLRHISTLPRCRELYCSNCTRLSELSYLPACRLIICNNCTALNRNTVPTQNDAVLTIKVENLNNDPLGILLELENSLIRERLYPIIKFVEPDGRLAAGVDAGGGSRVFIAKLIESLISHSKEPKQLLFFKTTSDLYMPFLNTKDLAVQIRGFKMFGALFELCYCKALSDQSTTTGIYFDRKVFEMITAFSMEELSQIDINKEALNIDRDIVEKLSPSTKIKLMSLLLDDKSKQILNLLEIPAQNLTLDDFEILRSVVLSNLDEETEEEKIPSNIRNDKLSIEEINDLKSFVQGYVRTFYLNNLPDEKIWIPCLIITKQMQELIGENDGWDHLVSLGASRLDNLIQGTMNRETLSSALNFNSENRKLDQEKVENATNFLKDWIKQANSKDLENLCKFITGSPTINPHKKLTIQLYDIIPSKLPTSHSCSFEMDLSINYENYEKFKEKLELALANISSNESSNLEIQ